MTHRHSPPDPEARLKLGIALNVGFVALEAVFGLLAHSLALIADAGHNLSDVLGLALAWAAAALGRRLPTTRRTYGLRRTTILAALANGVLLVAAVGVIGWEAIGRLSHPEPVAGRTVALVALAGIAINGVTAWLFIRDRDKDLNVRAAFLHMAADALVSAGVVVTGLLILWTGSNWLDPVVSLLVGVVILAGTWGLLRESLDLAMDAVPAHVDPATVDSYLRSLPGVEDVQDLHIWGMSTTEVAMTAHLVSNDTVKENVLAGARLVLKDRFGIGHTTIQVDSRRVPGEV